MQTIEEFINSDTFAQIWENQYLKAVGIAVGAFIVIWFVLKIVEMFVLVRLKSLADRTNTRLDDLAVKLVNAISWPFYFVLSIYFAFQFIEPTQRILNILDAIVLITVVFYVMRIIQEMIDFGFLKIIQKTLMSGEEYDPTVLNFFSNILKGVLWLLAGILVLQNLGYNVSALLGGIGILGIAVGFAVQNVLGDVFSFVSIYFDKPFQTGDFIVLDPDTMGTVEKVGVRSTRIKTLQGQQLVIPNNQITTKQINNYRVMNTRRVEFEFGVVYETPYAKLKKINKIVEDIIKGIDELEFNRIHFKAFGDSALIYQVVYVVQNKEYEVYMDTRQEINLQMVQAFEKEKIEFAYPTQKLFITSEK